MLDITREVYRRPEILKGMDMATTKVVRDEISEIVNRYAKLVKDKADAWNKDYAENSHGNEWYHSQKLEDLIQVELNKGVWDQILVCVDAHLAGEL